MWLRSTLRLAPTKACRDVHLARDLADVLPTVAAAMADGEVSAAHAQVLAGLRKDLRDEVVLSIDPHLADAARRMNPLDLRGFVTAVRHSYAREKVVRDERSMYDERRLHASTTLGGTGVGNWTCDPVSQETIMTAIHAASRPVVGDDRTPAQRRFDGLLTLCEIALNSGQLPETGGVKPHVTVTLSSESLQRWPGAEPARTAFGATISGDAAVCPESRELRPSVGWVVAAQHSGAPDRNMPTWVTPVGATRCAVTTQPTRHLPPHHPLGRRRTHVGGQRRSAVRPTP